MTYFSPEPKRRKEEFFNMEEELDKMKKSLRGKLTVVTGLRRTGKTSLILTFLNEENLDYVYLDCRLLPMGMFSLSSFLEILEDELNRKSWARKLLERVEGVKLGEFGIKLSRKEATVLNILRALEGKILVIDEAQELRRSPYRFTSLLAYA
ncbi:MAG: AAA family ATPase, partial [Archaeoglobaceae archaeon]|nr:AAA family ATPase [Archaeoglobaceae archaeon]MDW8118089.1 ATP-binding protein [Archaeoglobaceae archaeon]